LASTPLRPQLPPAGSFLLLAAAVLSYIPYLLAILAGPTWGDTGGEARYGAGWAILFALFFGSLLWFAIGGMVLLAWRRGHLPAAFAAAAAILYPLATIAAFAAARSYFTWPGGLSILVPTLLPPLLAVYALLARFSTFGYRPGAGDTGRRARRRGAPRARHDPVRLCRQDPVSRSSRGGAAADVQFFR